MVDNLMIREILQRAPWKVALISQRPAPGIGAALARGLKKARSAARQARDHFQRPSLTQRISDARVYGTDAPLARAWQMFEAKQRLKVRRAQGPSLWIWLIAGAPPHRIPSLEGVARMRAASLARWVLFIRRYGLIVGRPLVVADLWTPGKGADTRAEAYPANPIPVPRASDHLRLVRVPRNDLEAIARRAADLQKEMNAAVLGGLKARRAPQEAVTAALEDALRGFTPWVVTQPGAFGITDRWAFYSLGCWPFVVLQTLAYRSRTTKPVVCAADGCMNEVPPHRRKFCCDQCLWREKQRRHRDKKRPV